MGDICGQLLHTSQEREQSTNGITDRESTAADTVGAAPNGEPQNPVNSEAHVPNSSTISTDHGLPHHDQDACNAPPAACQPRNPANSETSVNGGGGISAGGQHHHRIPKKHLQLFLPPQPLLLLEMLKILRVQLL